MVETVRPAILLDVDGPLNPFRQGEKPRAPEYTMHLLRPKVFPGIAAKTLRVWLNPEHGEWLRELAEATGAELVWATTWEGEANRLIGPVLGLPSLRSVSFGGMRIRHSGGRHGKLAGVVAWAGRRPLCWFDDDFQVGDEDWAVERAAEGAPTRLIPVDPTVGLTREHIEIARDFLDGLREPGN
ncbi:HAD domain-containing protein [Nocardia sp. NPDC050406]|uniref:HAD domain-containing protein n=1 Tax=Nocardia sp. NPDC050406 TaxID=3364318 RepID=UPI0037B944BA